MLRPSNKVNEKMSPSHSQQLKSRTRCLRFRKFGHWRHKFQKRDNQPMNSVPLILTKKLGNSEQEISKTLWAVTEEEAEYKAYINSVNDEEKHEYIQDEKENSFQTMLSSMDNEKLDHEAAAEIYDKFNNMASLYQDRSDTECK